MAAAGQLRLEVFGGIHRGIDRPLDLLLNRLQSCENLIEFNLTDHHQVYIALRGFFPLGQRTVHERQLNPIRQGFERRAQQLKYSHGLCDQRLQFREDRTFLVGSIEDLVADAFGNQQSKIGEHGQFGSDRSRPYPDGGCYLTEIIGLVRVPKEES